MKIKNLLLSTLFAALVVLMSSCAGKLKPLDARQVSVDPQPLVLVGGEVPATININFPAKWFNKNAEVRVTPVLKYAGGEVWGTTYNFQGEKVRGNATTIPYGMPKSVTIHSNFKYKPEMAKSDLILIFSARIRGKEVQLPDVKIGEGVVATEALASATFTTPAIAPDAFQRIIKEKYDADIHFLIQQANVRSTELNSADVREWKGIVESANITPNQNVDVEIQAYASPDGGRELNEKLSAQRERNTTATIGRDLKRAKVEVPMSAHYTAQDWEGFQKLVEQSNIQDKELILSVLSMYKDPETREREIKNLKGDASRMTPARLQTMSLVCTAVIGLIVFAAAIEPPDLLVWINLFAFGGLEAVFLWPIILGLYWKEANASGAVASIVAGVACFFALSILKPGMGGIHAIAETVSQVEPQSKQPNEVEHYINRTRECLLDVICTVCRIS